MRKGFSLFETVLVLALFGLFCGMAMPHVSGMLDTIGVDAAANQVVSAHQRARLMAMAQGRVMVLTIDSAQLGIQVRGQEGILWWQEGPSADRVSLAGATRQFTFSPEGLTLGLSNATLDLTRGSAHRRVVVSRLGRIRVLR
jgi:Tfp pilus assembly protein FimT